MKTVLQFVILMLSFTIYSQINFSVTSLPPVMYGCGDWITIDSTTNQQAILLGGQSEVDVPAETSGMVKLFTQDINSNWVEKHDFNMISDNPQSSFFYQDNYVYVAFVTLFEGVRVFRALMDGNANFIEVYANYDTLYTKATITAIDINDDGFEDFLFSGLPYTGQTPAVGLLQNNGDGTFTPVTAPAIIPQALGGFYQSAILDNSGKKHLVVISDAVDAIFKNDGNGVFTQAFTLEDTPRYTHVAITDFNNDGLNDISVIAPDDSDSSGTTLYKNLGNLNFESYDFNYSGLPNVYYGEMKFADINNDGFVDAVVAAELPGFIKVTKIMWGSDDFKFFGGEYTLTKQNGDPIYISKGTVAIKDYNNDGKQDVLLTGNATVIENIREPQSWLLTNTSTLSVEQFNGEGFTMYPNPARDIVSFKGIDTIKSIDVYNQIGQKVLFANETHLLNIETLSEGLYLVLITDGNQRIFQKKLVVK